jgi:hypothetical protein
MGKKKSDSSGGLVSKTALGITLLLVSALVAGMPLFRSLVQFKMRHRVFWETMESCGRWKDFVRKGIWLRGMKGMESGSGY